MSRAAPNPAESDYTVDADGPILIAGALRRRGDRVSLTDKEAAAFGRAVSRADAPVTTDAPKSSKPKAVRK